jgi:trk system potassium uptake protein TrkA
MNCVIVGYGRVGTRTANILENEGHDVVVVENDPEKVERARETDLTVIEGDGASTDVLQEADLDRADAVGGLTGDPETNFAACTVGNDHGCRTVLRISEDFSEDVYRQYSEGVDEIIYPEQLGAAGAKTALLGGDFSVLADITEHLSAATLTVPDDSPAIGERVVNLDVPEEARIYAHGRADEPMTIPLPRTAIEAGDQLALIADPDAVLAVRDRIHGTNEASEP